MRDIRALDRRKALPKCPEVHDILIGHFCIICVRKDRKIMLPVRIYPVAQSSSELFKRPISDAVCAAH